MRQRGICISLLTQSHSQIHMRGQAVWFKRKRFFKHFNGFVGFSTFGKS